MDCIVLRGPRDVMHVIELARVEHFLQVDRRLLLLSRVTRGRILGDLVRPLHCHCRAHQHRIVIIELHLLLVLLRRTQSPHVLVQTFI